MEECLAINSQIDTDYKEININYNSLKKKIYIRYRGQIRDMLHNFNKEFISETAAIM